MATLDGKTAIVTGAAQGIGQAVAQKLQKQGAHVVSVDENPAITGMDNVLGLQADVSQRAEVERIVATTLDRFGGIDILVNNAAHWRPTPVTSSWEQALEDWDYIMNTNLKGVLMLSRACVPHLKQGGGHIINMSAYYVLPAKTPGTNSPMTDLYNASKWALNGFTDAWASQLAEHNVTVNAICMGATDTPMLRGAFPDGELPPEFAATVIQADDIAQLVLDIMADGRTGENIGAWAGEPVALPPRKAPNKRITG